MKLIIPCDVIVDAVHNSFSVKLMSVLVLYGELYRGPIRQKKRGDACNS